MAGRPSLSEICGWWSGKTPLNEYLICWDRFLVRIALDWEPDSEDIKVIREKLSAPVLERKL